MGYCYITGKKDPINGHWTFIKCDGRTNSCPQHDNNPRADVEGPASKVCVEWCKKHKEAVNAIEDWMRIHQEDK